MKLNKPFKYTLMALFAIVISKYLLLWWMPASSLPEKPATTPVENNTSSIFKPQEIKLTIDYSALKPKVEEEYVKAKSEIVAYIDEALGEQKQRAYYNLSKEDGFLDWIFGYFTGYKMMWKKIKGYFGSDDNEIKMVSDKFQSEVMYPGYDQTMRNIQSYVQNRTEDYYKTVITLTSEYLNTQTVRLKNRGFGTIKVDEQQIPWNKYIVTTSSDGFVLLELTGVTGVSVFLGKMVGGKVAALLGPKMLGFLSAKAASAVAGKIVASFSLLFAPIVDYAINEGSKAVQYEKTQKEFKGMIDETFEEMQRQVKKQALQILQDVKNDMYRELNTHTTVKAVK